MKRKILIGSIFAVVLLILVSFYNVVGYSSVKSDIKIDSPLFSIRNNKGDVSSDYLGKGTKANIILPKRDNEADLFDKFIDMFKLMDDETFDIFVKKFTTYINHNIKDNIKFSDKEIKNVLYDIKSNPDAIKAINKERSYTYIRCNPITFDYGLYFTILCWLELIIQSFIITFLAIFLIFITFIALLVAAPLIIVITIGKIINNPSY